MNEGMPYDPLQGQGQGQGHGASEIPKIALFQVSPIWPITNVIGHIGDTWKSIPDVWRYDVKLYSIQVYLRHLQRELANDH